MIWRKKGRLSSTGFQFKGKADAYECTLCGQMLVGHVYKYDNANWWCRAVKDGKCHWRSCVRCMVSYDVRTNKAMPITREDWSMFERDLT